MTFNSFPFIFIFLPFVLGGYFLLNRSGHSAYGKIWLVMGSLVFVACSRVEDALLVLGSAAVNCFFAERLAAKKGCWRLSHRALLVAGIVINVAFLCYFKYADFFMETVNRVLGTSHRIPQAAFPLGISFYTIYQIMLLVDCYEGLVEKHNWLDHLVFASFFPCVTMGPIVRWKQVVPQLNNASAQTVDVDNIARGLFVFVLGLFKKVVLADSFFRWADAGFRYNHPLSLVGSWMAALAFTCELYFDFSGYTDMALGAALMLNVKLPQNFNSPFRAQSVIDFWRRWHMTLTNFITTYLYTPMIRVRARVTFGAAMMATFLSMLIAGLWHGANWTFVVFGVLHGAALVINHGWRKLKWAMPGAAAWALTFTLVVVSLVFFRADSVGQGARMVASMFSLRAGLFSYEPWVGIDRMDQLTGIAWMVFGVAALLRAPSSMEVQNKFRPSWATVAQTVALAVVACIYANGVVSRSFVYRDF